MLVHVVNQLQSSTLLFTQPVAKQTWSEKKKLAVFWEGRDEAKQKGGVLQLIYH